MADKPKLKSCPDHGLNNASHLNSCDKCSVAYYFNRKAKQDFILQQEEERLKKREEERLKKLEEQKKEELERDHAEALRENEARKEDTLREAEREAYSEKPGEDRRLERREAFRKAREAEEETFPERVEDVSQAEEEAYSHKKWLNWKGRGKTFLRGRRRPESGEPGKIGGILGGIGWFFKGKQILLLLFLLILLLLFFKSCGTGESGSKSMVDNVIPDIHDGAPPKLSGNPFEDGIESIPELLSPRTLNRNVEAIKKVIRGEGGGTSEKGGSLTGRAVEDLKKGNDIFSKINPAKQLEKETKDIIDYLLMFLIYVGIGAAVVFAIMHGKLGEVVLAFIGSQLFAVLTPTMNVYLYVILLAAFISVAIHFPYANMYGWICFAVVYFLMYFLIYKVEEVAAFVANLGLHPFFLCLALGILLSSLLLHNKDGQKALFFKKEFWIGFVILVILLVAYMLMASALAGKNAETKARSVGPIAYIKNLAYTFFETTKEQIGFGTPDTIEHQEKTGIVFSDILSPYPFYYASAAGVPLIPVTVDAVGVKVDTFKSKPTQVEFTCKYKKDTDPDIGLGLAYYQNKPAAVIGKQNPLQISSAMGNQITLNVRCMFDDKDPYFRVDFGRNAGDAMQQRNENDLESESKEIVFVGTYKDFTTLTCLNIPTVKEEFYSESLVQEQEAGCLQGCGLAVINIETQQPWIFPKGEGSRHTRIYPLILNLQKHTSFDGDMLKMKSLKLAYDKAVFKLQTDTQFINGEILDENHPLLDNLNKKFDMRQKNEYTEITERDKTFYYSFELTGTSNPQGKMQASKICAEAVYDYQFTKSTSVEFKEKAAALNAPSTSQPAKQTASQSMGGSF